MAELSIYIHIPFCTTKCSYCAFNTYTSVEDLIPAYLDSLSEEIALVGKSGTGTSLLTVSIYFGGGTPSLLTTAQFEQLLCVIYANFAVRDTVEVTFEANPNDLTESQPLRRLFDMGINRLSIGMQSAIDSELKAFNRRHTNGMTEDAISFARRGGFDNINIDLMFGFPEQTLESWRGSLNATVSLEPEHVSLYALGLEPGTSLEFDVRRGLQIMPDDDLIAEMYEFASEQLLKAGYVQYEISNWARPGYQCRHNLQYWRNESYLGFGAGAHGYANGQRYEVIRSPKVYIAKINEISSMNNYQFPQSPAIHNSAHVDYSDEISETLITNLRLLQEGLDREKFRDRFGVDVLEIHGHSLQRFAAMNLLSITPQTIRLTAKGRLVSNLVFRDLI